MGKTAKTISVRSFEYERFQNAARERGMSVELADRIWANMPQTSRIKHGG